jgi:O-antigen/teichoic acid export membrane protein
MLPPGTQLVVGGTALLGVASYIQLAAAGHRLDTPALSSVSVLWSLVMALSLGIFFPVEQELTRIVAARAVRGEGAGPVLRRGAWFTLGLAALLSAVLAAVQRPLADWLFGGDRSLVWAFAGTLFGMGLTYLTRGVQAGLGRFRVYGASLALDGGLRIAFAVGAALAGVHSAAVYGLVLAVAPFLSFLLTLPPTLRGSGPGPALSWPDLLPNLGMMICSQVLAQFVVNASVLSTQVLSPTSTGLVAAVLQAAVLCRVPLFVFGSMQPTLMTGLSTAVTAGDRPGFRRMLLRTVAVVSGLGLAGGVPAALLGPWLIEVFFKAPPGLGDLDFLWFSLGTVCYMLAMVLGQALLAVRRHRQQLLCWAAGTAVLLGAACVPGPVALRVELGYALGSAAAALSMLAVLARRGARRARPATEPAGRRPVELSRQG